MTSRASSRMPGYLAIALAAGAVFALGLGVRQSQALFIGPINSSTGVGYASVTLAFAVGQLMWGIGAPLAGAIADRTGHRTVMVAGVLPVPAAPPAGPPAPSSGAAALL